jgi:hypothetical protein
VVAASVLAVELQEQLFAWERELDTRKGALMAQEDGLAASKCTLGRACMKCGAKCDRARAIRQDYQARIHAFTAGCRRSFDFDWVLEGHQFLLSLKETNIE